MNALMSQPATVEETGELPETSSETSAVVTPLNAATLSEWRGKNEEFLAGCFNELRELMEALETRLSEPRGTTNEFASPPTEREEIFTPSPEPNSPGVNRGPVPAQRKPSADNAQERLAELARQLDERLQRFRRQEDR